jgi:hypothetical protein
LVPYMLGTPSPLPDDPYLELGPSPTLKNVRDGHQRQPIQSPGRLDRRLQWALPSYGLHAGVDIK